MANAARLVNGCNVRHDRCSACVQLPTMSQSYNEEANDVVEVS